MRPNPYEVIPATVESVTQESPLIRTLRLRPERPFSFQTGQFIELSLPGVGEAPFTPSSSHFVSDWMDVTIMKAGFVTEHVHRARPGDRVGLRGPFGSWYPLEKFEGQDVLLIGGGAGLAPLRSLFLTLLEKADKYKSITFFAGAKTPQDFIYKDAFSAWKIHPKVRLFRAVDGCPVDEKWDEEICLVTKLLDKLKEPPGNKPVVVCGPPLMMKFGARDLLRKGFKEENIYLSLEKKMYCGFGQCRHCVTGEYFVCKDGPVFTYAKVKNEEGIWD
ncbi:MAG: FAD/NAD(P)-binding protein [Candidatus Aminicenantes bacterium]|nr:FAD/NAD(P)-binding protein [Candidatus Aminicenantes bacterium]